MRAHHASRSALIASRIVLLVGDDPLRAPLLPRGAVETTQALLREAGMLSPWYRRAHRSTRVRTLVDWGERTLLPGWTTHVALRKRFLDDETAAAIEAGASQVLVIGGGFDTLGLRRARLHPAVRIIELDHPAVQSLKRHSIEQLGAPPENLLLHPVDLDVTSVADALDEVEWDRRARSVIMVEGILTYLAEDEVADFLRGIASGLGPRSRLLGAYRLPDAHGRPRASRLGRLDRASRRAKREPLPWAVTPEDMAAMLEDSGLHILDDPGHVDLRLRYLVPEGLDPLPLATVERVLRADRA